MKRLFALPALAGITTALLQPVATLAAASPNIVFVLFDDMGWGQPQSYSPGSALRRPNLDRMAAERTRSCPLPRAG